MKLPRYVPSSKEPTNEYEKDLDRSLDRILASLFQIVNSGLNFGDNFDCFITTITTSATPGQETAIAHGLKRAPVGFLVIEKDKVADIFLGQSGILARNSPVNETLLIENYFVQSNVASVKINLIIF